MDLSILDSFDDLERRVSSFDGSYREKERSLLSLRADVKDLTKEEAILIKVQKTITHLMDSLVEKDMSKMDNLINYGINLVFPDRNIKFKSELRDTGKKFFIDLKTLENGNELTADSYGSVSVIQSFLLRLLCLLKMNRGRLLILDESFAAVGDKYINNVGNLISELADKLKIDILLVTHNPGVVDSTVFKAALEKQDPKSASETISITKLKDKGEL
jgi:hypothetical protein